MPSFTGITSTFFEKLVGEIISGVRIVGKRLIVLRRNGNDIDAGDNAGIEATNPTAATVKVTPAGTITSTNVQAAAQELAGDLATVSNNKADKSALPKIISGTVSHLCDVDSDGASVRTVVDYVNVFPSGYFASNPNVVITPATGGPAYLAKGFSVLNINRRSFSINAWSGHSPPRMTFYWVAAET